MPGPRSHGRAISHVVVRLLVLGLIAVGAGCAQVRPIPQPTPTASGTRPAEPRNCIQTPHLCGYPDHTNTGVPADVPLAGVPSEVTEGDGWRWREDVRAVVVEDPGTTIANLAITNGQVIVQARAVVLRNVRISTTAHYPINCAWTGETREADSCLGLLAEDVEIHGLSLDCHTGMAFNGYTARRVYVHGCQDGFKVGSDVVVEDSFVQDLASDGGTHNDAVQTTGGRNVRIRHNTFKLGDMPAANAVIQFGTEQSPSVSGWRIEDNLMDGGGWTFNSSPRVEDTVVQNNRFTRRYRYGIAEMAEVVWLRNFYDDTGEPVPQTP